MGGIVMKQFNLEEYLKNPDREVVTRDGRKVRIICTDFDNPDYPVVGEINGNKWPLSFMANGESIKGRQLSCDLFFAPTKHEGWINVYKENKYFKGQCIYPSEKEAYNEGKNIYNYIATVKIEWEG